VTEFRVLSSMLHPLRVVRVVCLTLCAITLGTACSGREPLGQAAASPDALGKAVLAALEHGDETTLHDLAVTEQEFREHVWPDLPAARPERNLPFSYVWGDLRQKSDASLRGTLAEYRGRHFELVGIRSTGETTRYNTYLVHRETVLSVRDSDGAVHELRVFGSTLQKDGVWKVFSYVVDN